MKQKEGERRSWVLIEHQGVHRPAAYWPWTWFSYSAHLCSKGSRGSPKGQERGLTFCIIFQILCLALAKRCCESVFSVQEPHSSSSCCNRNIQTSWVLKKETTWYFLCNTFNHPPPITGGPGITSGSLLTTNCEGYSTTDSKAYEFFFLHPDSILMLRNQNYWIAFNLQNGVNLGGPHSCFICSLGLSQIPFSLSWLELILVASSEGDTGCSWYFFFPSTANYYNDVNLSKVYPWVRPLSTAKVRNHWNEVIHLRSRNRYVVEALKDSGMMTGQL